MSGLRLKIRQNSLEPSDCQVWIEDVEISHGLRALELFFDMKSFPRAVLRINVENLDVDAATIAILQAMMSDKEAKHGNSN